MIRALGPGLVAMTLLVGCAGRVAAPGEEAWVGTTATTAFAPVPNSPGNLVTLVSSTWNRLDWQGYGDLLTDDFRFAFAEADSAGNVYRGVPFTRDDEIYVARHMFESGTADEPPFVRVALLFARPLAVVPDPRPGKNPMFHRYVRAELALSADTHERSYRITGAAGLYMVRGDSALIPPALVARGVRPDSARWWLERWEDETLDAPAGAGQAATSARISTLGRLKLLYR